MFVSMEEEINKAVDILRKGKVLLYPTDTVWGIGCDATQVKAVQKVYKIKNRTNEKSAIVLIDNVKKIAQYVKEVPSVAYDLIEQSPVPLTIIFNGGKNVAKNVLAKDGTIAIRVVKGDFCVKMLQRFGKPVVSTSANFTGEPTPLVFNDINDTIKKNVDYIVAVHRDRIRTTKASTIIKLKLNNSFTILRE